MAGFFDFIGSALGNMFGGSGTGSAGNTWGNDLFNFGSGNSFGFDARMGDLLGANTTGSFGQLGEVAKAANFALPSLPDMVNKSTNNNNNLFDGILGNMDLGDLAKYGMAYMNYNQRQNLNDEMMKQMKRAALAWQKDREIRNAITGDVLNRANRLRMQPDPNIKGQQSYYAMTGYKPQNWDLSKIG